MPRRKHPKPDLPTPSAQAKVAKKKLHPAVEAALLRAPTPPKIGKQVDPRHLELLHDMMVSGLPWYEVQRELCKLWGVTTRTIRNYRRMLVSQMRDEDADDMASTVEFRRTLTRQQIDAGKAKAFAKDDMHSYNALIKTGMWLDGLMGPQRVEHRFPEGVPAVTPEMTDEQIAAELEAARRLAERVKTVAAAAATAAPNVPGA